jgi:hypothetical protein
MGVKNASDDLNQSYGVSGQCGLWRQFAIEICHLAGGANKCKGTFDACQLPVTTCMMRRKMKETLLSEKQGRVILCS